MQAREQPICMLHEICSNQRQLLQNLQVPTQDSGRARSSARSDVELAGLIGLLGQVGGNHSAPAKAPPIQDTVSGCAAIVVSKLHNDPAEPRRGRCARRCWAWDDHIVDLAKLRRAKSE